MSGEHSTEGRRAVALKKLRELRIGGREENELVEEFVGRVLYLLDEGRGEETKGEETTSKDYQW